MTLTILLTVANIFVVTDNFGVVMLGPCKAVIVVSIPRFLATSEGIWQGDYRRVGGQAGGWVGGRKRR